MEFDFTKFNPTALKVALVAGAEATEFPNITEEWLNGFREWVNDDENWAFVLDRRDKWEKQGGLETPDDPDPQPQTREIMVRNTGKQMHCDGVWYDKFVFPKLGPQYTSKPFMIVFSDGIRLFVDNPKEMRMRVTGEKYQPGGKYSDNNPDIPTMEIYARGGTHPEWVKVLFRD